MPDIAMCANEKCPLSSKCYRFMAHPNPYWQSYSDFKPYLNEEGEPECEYFMEIYNKKDYE